MRMYEQVVHDDGGYQVVHDVGGYHVVHEVGGYHVVHGWVQGCVVHEGSPPVTDLRVILREKRYHCSISKILKDSRVCAVGWLKKL